MKKLLAVAVLMLASSLAIALEGDPIPGANVKVGRKPPGDPHSIAQGTTDAQGSCTFKDLPDGTFYVTFDVGGTNYEVFENSIGDPVRVVRNPQTSRMAAVPVVTTKKFGDVNVAVEVLGNTIKATIAKQKNAAQTTKR